MYFCNGFQQREAGDGKGLQRGERGGRGKKNRCGQSRLLHLQMIFFFKCSSHRLLQPLDAFKLHSKPSNLFNLVGQQQQFMFIPRGAICLISIYEVLFHITAHRNRSCLIFFLAETPLDSLCPLNHKFCTRFRKGIISRFE